MKYLYLLGDDGGVSNCEDVEILLPLGTKFRHEYGIYCVVTYVDKDGEETDKFSKIEKVYCERLFDNNEIAEGKHKK